MGITEAAAIVAITVGGCALIDYGHAFYKWIKRQRGNDDPPAS